MECLCRSKHNGKNGSRHDHVLRPSPSNQVWSKSIPGQAHNRKHTGLDHSHGMKQGCDRGRGNGSAQQPFMSRKNSGFDTKTAGYGYQRLKALKPQEIWDEVLKDQKPEDEREGGGTWQ